MSDSGPSALALVAGTFAVVFFLLDLAMSSLLAASSAVSRVALHRLSQEGGARTAHLDDLVLPVSSFRLAALVFRQVGLVGGCVWCGVAAHAAGWTAAWPLAPALAGAAGILVLEALTAHFLALRYPRAVLKATSVPLRMLHAVALPLLAPLASVMNRLRAEPNGDENGEEEQDEEAEAFIAVAERDGILEKDEGRMVRGIIDLGDTRVREIMTPRTDIVALRADGTIDQAIQVVQQANHSRLPVFRSSIDEVVGILHVRDLVGAWVEGHHESSVMTFVRPAMFVPETMSVADLLKEMRTRTHIALVVDEYGGVAGLVTLEDLLEEIVGDIRDEHDRGEAVIEQEGPDCWLVSGVAHVKELEDLFGLDFAEERDFDTVGGLVVSRMGRVPLEGEAMSFDGLRFEVVKADPRRVYRLRIRAEDDRDARGTEGRA